MAAAYSSQAAPAKAREKITPKTPDLEQIRADVSNPSSPYYYPKLFARYQQNETVMNLEDYRHLYYGALFQEDFNPYRHSEASTKNDGLYYKNNHTRAELDSIIYYAEEVLADDPFNLSQMNYLIYALPAGAISRRAAAATMSTRGMSSTPAMNTISSTSRTPWPATSSTKNLISTASRWRRSPARTGR